MSEALESAAECGGVPILVPNPGPQTEAWLCDAMEVFFGGGRGSGKSFWLFCKVLQHLTAYRGRAKMILFRENVDDLGDLIEKGKSLLEETGLADYISGQSRLFRFKGPFDGATLKMRHLEKLDDLKAYKGHEYTLIGLDEVCDYSVPFEKLRDAFLACLRNPHGIQGQILYTGNPGGYNHAAVKAFFFDPWPAGRRIIRNEFGQTRCFFQATVLDNPKLADDAAYRAQLAGIRDPVLRRAWQDGDWTVAMGAMFSDVFSYDKHVLKFSISANDIPDNWRRYRALDWGSSKPYACLWYTVATGEELASDTLNKLMRGRTFPAGSLIFYREEYGWKPGNARDEGVKLSSSEVAEIIRKREMYEGEGNRVRPGPADTQIFAVLDGTPIYQNFYNAGVYFVPANKSPGSIKAGCELIRDRLIGEEDRPLIYFTRDCTHTIRTLPVLARDKMDADVPAPRQEDHLCDVLRYACTAVTLTPTTAAEEAREMSSREAFQRELFEEAS
jgi:phage terminase large subunit